MHKSRLGTVVIDCKTDDLDHVAQFWGQALGHDVLHRYQPGDENYRGLTSNPTQPKILVQRVNHSSRVHLDIETDNVEAEVERLVNIGATKIEKVRDWWVMEAPTGHRFCVVPVQRPDFESEANTWNTL
ncbi:MAG: VOC family protein [Gammaproteobacteria bacterium]|nr:VOC family protein [Gammaproteobacteria bacterium]MDH3468084.1 VOC family protein [Gammaproteobacteria bacterium]